MSESSARGAESARRRLGRAIRTVAFDQIRQKKLIETTADEWVELNQVERAKAQIVAFLQPLSS